MGYKTDLFTEQTCCVEGCCLIYCRNSERPRNKVGELQRYTHREVKKACTTILHLCMPQVNSVMQGKALLCCELVVRTPSQVDRSSQGSSQAAGSLWAPRVVALVALALASSCVAHWEAGPASCRVTHLSTAILVPTAGWGLPCVYGHCPAAGRANQGCILSAVTGQCHKQKRTGSQTKWQSQN